MKHKIPQGYVLVRLTDKPDEMKVGEMTIYLDPSYNPADHAPINGIVEIVPNRLIVSHDNMEWDTTMDVKVGDKVQLTTFEVMNCLGDSYDKIDQFPESRYIKDGDDFLIFAHYSSIILCNGEPINGYCIVEPIEEDYEGVLKIEKSNRVSVGKILKAASKNNFYVQATGGHGFVMVDREKGDVSVGDTVIFRRFADIKLERTDNWRIQRKHMLAIYPDKPLNDNVIMKKCDPKLDIIVPEMAKLKYTTYEVIAGYECPYVICKTGTPIEYDVNGQTYSVIANRNILVGLEEFKQAR